MYGEIITIQIYGQTERARVLVVRPHGTIDVERLSDGQCFRVTGLRGVPPLAEDPPEMPER